MSTQENEYGWEQSKVSCSSNNKKSVNFSVNDAYFMSLVGISPKTFLKDFFGIEGQPYGYITWPIEIYSLIRQARKFQRMETSV